MFVFYHQSFMHVVNGIFVACKKVNELHGCVPKK